MSFLSKLFPPRPPAPPPFWEEIANGELCRCEVPGGWIYRRTADGGSSGPTRAMVFVPRPKKKKRKK